jgi:hypothetical protein
MRSEMVGRKGLARILDVCEGTTRNMERSGLIAPETVIDGRALFSVEKARKLRASRDTRRVANSAD